jgi:hypothetical protein
MRRRGSRIDPRHHQEPREVLRELAHREIWAGRHPRPTQQVGQPLRPHGGSGAHPRIRHAERLLSPHSISTVRRKNFATPQRRKSCGRRRLVECLVTPLRRPSTALRARPQRLIRNRRSSERTCWLRFQRLLIKLRRGTTTGVRQSPCGRRVFASSDQRPTDRQCTA